MEEKYSGSLTKSSEIVTQITARPAPKFKFIKDNRELLIKDRFKVDYNTISENVTELKLTINDIVATDAGIYKIEASNKCANTIAQTEFVVKGIKITRK